MQSQVDDITISVYLEASFHFPLLSLSLFSLSPISFCNFFAAVGQVNFISPTQTRTATTTTATTRTTQLTDEFISFLDRDFWATNDGTAKGKVLCVREKGRQGFKDCPVWESRQKATTTTTT